MLAHRLPFPPNKGDKIRAFHVLSHLAKRHEVALACLVDDEADLVHLDALRKIVPQLAVAPITGRFRRLTSMRAMLPGSAERSITVTHFHSSELQSQVDAWLDAEAFDGVLCSSAAMAEYVFRSTHRETSLRKMVKAMDLIDVDSKKWAQYADEAPPWTSWIYRHEAHWLSRYEHTIVSEFDRVFLVSPAEASLLDAAEAPGKVGSFSNGVDLDFFKPRSSISASDAKPLLVFTGVMDYRPNVEGVDWFARQVLPLIREAVPGAGFAIVGSRPNQQVRALAGLPGVTVTGFVEDVRDWLARATVCVAPLMIARGIQNKVLEAMAMARPVVASPQAYEGVEALAGRDLVVADGAAAFAQAVVALINDPARAQAIGESARACVERGYQWESNLAVLDEVFS